MDRLFADCPYCKMSGYIEIYITSTAMFEEIYACGYCHEKFTYSEAVMQEELETLVISKVSEEAGRVGQKYSKNACKKTGSRIRKMWFVVVFFSYWLLG